MSVQEIFDSHYSAIQEGWLRTLETHADFADLGPDALRTLTGELLRAASRAADGSAVAEMERRALSFSRRAGSLDIDARQTAGMVALLKRPLLHVVQEIDDSPEVLWQVLDWVDALVLQVLGRRIEGLLEVNELQRQEVLDLSTPVVRLWEGIVLMPLIGTLDSERSAAVLETLLKGVEETNAEVAILDISGVPTVDSEVARRLIRAAAAVRLMGAELYISGVGPRIAQTIVTLGLDLGGVKTTSSLSKGLRRALAHRGLGVAKT